MEKRGNSKAQIAIEYILIIVIALLILLPGIYMFRGYAFESNDKIIDKRLAEISNQLIAKALKMYYYGPPSKTSFAVEMPPQINNMYILSVSGGNESYLVFKALTSSGEKEYMYFSDAPLDAEADLCNSINEECLKGFCKCFPERFYTKGMKNFVIQAKEKCNFGSTQKICVVFNESSEP